MRTHLPRLAIGSLSLLGAVAWAAPALADTSVITPDVPAVAFPDHDFPDGAHPSVPITFSNAGGTDATVSGVAITGPDAGQFTIASDACGGQFMSGAGSSCVVDVQFAPAAAGPMAATIELADDTGVVDLPLQGLATTGTLNAVPPSFPSQPDYYCDPSAQVTLIGGPSGQVQSTSWAITGPDASRFYLQSGDSCFHESYFPGNTCNTWIGLRGGTPGTDHAQLEVTNDGTASPLLIPLDATQLNGPHISVNPHQVAFGDVAVGQEASTPVTVTNDGDSDLQVAQALMITGLRDVLSAGDDACSGQVVAPGGSCQGVVRFAPAFAGRVNGPLFLTTGNSPQPVVSIGVSGNGVTAASAGPPLTAPTANLDPSPLAAPDAAPGAAMARVPPRGAAALTGVPLAGRRLTCSPVGYAPGVEFSFRWLRDERGVAGATASTLTLRRRDVGSRFSCRVRATNPAGSEVVASPTSARARPRRPGPGRAADSAWRVKAAS